MYAVNQTVRKYLTETEMYIIREVLWQCGEVLVCFDERTDDKEILFVTADEPMMLRYIIDSPAFTDQQKEHARSVLGELLVNEEPVVGDDDYHDRVLYSANS